MLNLGEHGGWTLSESKAGACIRLELCWARSCGCYALFCSQGPVQSLQSQCCCFHLVQLIHTWSRTSPYWNSNRWNSIWPNLPCCPISFWWLSSIIQELAMEIMEAKHGQSVKGFESVLVKRTIHLGCSDVLSNYKICARLRLTTYSFAKSWLDYWKPSSIKLDCLKGNMFEYFCAKQSARSVLMLYSLRRLRNLALDADLLAQLPLLVLTHRCAKPVDLTLMRPGLDSENWLAKSWH